MSRGRMPIGEPTSFTAPPYGLLSTATEVDVTENQWKMGITWEPLCPNVSGTLDPCVAVQDDGAGGVEPITANDLEDKTETTGWSIQGATPFTAYAEIDCSPVGVWDQLPERARRALTQAEEQFVERTFWTGAVSGYTGETVYPHLAENSEVIDGADLMQPAATVVTSEPQDVETGIGMLHQAARECYPGQITMHAPLRMGSLLANHTNLVTRGGVAQTMTGANIVLGAGYPGTAPDGTNTEGVTWVYATGPVFYMRDPIIQLRLRESIDRTVNTVRVITERTYVVGFSCCLLAIPILNGELTTS